ncbi:MAG: PLP-dependent cysteine synthase family protein [Candidatus Neomarinimicrobiota bacterium]|nr:MAG: PLP-dependent cysteine synthase family protein [Candidatus Neomarinimicrobiota bacterium]
MEQSYLVEVGHTPLVNVEGIFAKLECVNPCGSIKDRIAKYILQHSEARGWLRKGMTIVEATSGNTGIALSYFAREMGYPITIVMPENMTEERKQVMRNLGANLILCSEEGSFAEAARIRDRMAEEDTYFNTDQFSNPLNVECHETTTGAEILSQLGQQELLPDAFVAGVGTGGTLMGVGRALRKVNPDLALIAVEPAESAVMSGGKQGTHGIPGIGDGFIPAIVSDGQGGISPLIDEVLCIASEDAREEALRLQEEYGICVGISSGANFLAAKQVQKRYRTVVTVFPDGYARYQSRGLSHCEEAACRYERNRINVLEPLHHP